MQREEVSERVRLVSLSGFLDAAAVGRLEAGFAAQVAAGDKSVVVDLGGVEFCGSLGIRMLLASARVAERRGQRLVLAAARPEVRQVFDTVALGTLVPLADTVEDAKALLGA